MSTADPIPETWELTGDDARETLKRTGTRTLVKDGFHRFRIADGFSHARSMAFVTTLVLVQGIIALVGLASAIGTNGVGNLIVKTMRATVPGPASAALTDAVAQAHKAGSGHRYLALTLGSIGALITATTLMGQIERALNRIYGIESDRPTAQKYLHAFALALTAGVLSATAFTALALGRSLGDSFSSGSLSSTWSVVRWPLALACLLAGIALLFRYAPDRHQPAWSWLAFGAGVSVALLLVVTIGLDEVFRLSSTFGKTYGPLASLVALMLWALLASIGLLLGAALAAQLEAVRSGHAETQSPAKVVASQPEHASVG